MALAWFVDGSYIRKIWFTEFGSSQAIDFTRLRRFLEAQFGDGIEDAYFFDADPDPPTAQRNAFHNWLAVAPPNGPGLRVKLYWLNHRDLYWPRAMGGQPVLHPETGTQYRLTQQKAVDVGLAFHLMRSFSKRRWDQLALCAGDGDFHEVVQHLVENEDVALGLVGSSASISSELRPYARRGIFDIVSLAPQLCRITPSVPIMRAEETFEG